MTNRERFECALAHRTPDRVPIDYLAVPVIDAKLKQFYGVDTEQELLEALGCDFYYLSCRDISQNESSLPFYKGPPLEITTNERVCPFGIRWRRGVYNSKFAADQAIEGPLENAQNEKDILSHNWPKVDWFDLEPLHKEYEQNTQRVIIGGFWSGILGDSYRMHGFENFLLNLAAKPDFIKVLVHRMTDFYLDLNDKLFSEMKGKIDIWFFGNDFGSQESLLFSPRTFGDLFLGNIKGLTKLAHSYGIKVMMHSCGAIFEIIPSLIEAGIEILDPVQVTATGMEPEKLKKTFGNEIVFHGAIDTQHVLPNFQPQEVSDYCRKVINILGKNGGYVFAPSQVLGSDIPVENIHNMYETAKGLGC